MRADIVRVKAAQVKPGHTICFYNSRMDYKVEAVEDTRLGDIRFRHGSASDCVKPGDYVFIKKGDL